MMYDKLKEPGRLPMHMPGHKRSTAIAPYLQELGAFMDITEIDGFDNLHNPTGIIADCMERASHIWGSRRSYLLINGTTCGILAGMRTMTRRGDRVLINRDAHKSVFHAIELCGLEPVFFTPPVIEPLDIFGSATAEIIDAQLEKHPDIRLVLATSPTYEGIISDIAGICRTAHRHGIPVMVDEAHGAHLGLGGDFPAGAVKNGADMVVQSLHKTLPSLTQTAMLHVCSERVDRQRLEHQLAVFETSSPSYLLMASIDGCVRLLEQNRALLTDWSEALCLFDERIRQLEKLRVIGHNTEISAHAFDRSKLPIFTGFAGLSGYELADILRSEFSIEPEYAAPRMTLCMTGAGDTAESLLRLADALLTIDSRCSHSSPENTTPVSSLTGFTELTMHPEKAMEAPAEMIPLAMAAGRICGEYVWAYPPGIPLLIPGERIPAELYSMTENGTAPELHSTSGMMPEYIRALS